MIFLLFFLSGFTALLYEVVWQRLLHLTFGLSTYAVTTVTASFMLGLALGYLLGKSRCLVRYHSLVVYGVAEGLISVFALVFPWLVWLIDTVYVAAGGSFFLNVILSLIALALPATLMGLTLPTLTRYVVQDGPADRLTLRPEHHRVGPGRVFRRCLLHPYLWGVHHYPHCYDYQCRDLPGGADTAT